MYARRRLATAVAAAVLAGGLASPTLAADTGTVDVSIDVASPCIVVTPNVVYFDTLPIGDLAGTDTGLTYTNCSVAPERIYGRVTDATGPGGVTWTPTDFNFDPSTGTGWCPGIGLNKYAVLMIRDAEGLSLRILDRELETVQPEATGTYDRLGIAMPCAGSDGGGSVMSFTTTFTATF
jgi:hypothetical protein